MDAKDLEAVANGYTNHRSIAGTSGREDTEEFRWTSLYIYTADTRMSFSSKAQTKRMTNIKQYANILSWLSRVSSWMHHFKLTWKRQVSKWAMKYQAMSKITSWLTTEPHVQWGPQCTPAVLQEHPRFPFLAGPFRRVRTCSYTSKLLHFPQSYQTISFVKIDISFRWKNKQSYLYSTDAN